MTMRLVFRKCLIPHFANGKSTCTTNISPNVHLQTMPVRFSNLILQTGSRLLRLTFPQTWKHLQTMPVSSQPFLKLYSIRQSIVLPSTAHSLKHDYLSETFKDTPTINTFLFLFQIGAPFHLLSMHSIYSSITQHPSSSSN